VPRYIIEREVGKLSAADLGAAGRRSNAVLAAMDGVVWIKSYVSDAEGKIYCEYEAPNAEAVLEHARRSGLPANRISEVSLEISPSMFL
jgi:Protein of unknown function (DUF4242)